MKVKIKKLVPEKLYDSTTFEVNSILYNPILVNLHTGISVMFIIIYSI